MNKRQKSKQVSRRAALQQSNTNTSEDLQTLGFRGLGYAQRGTRPLKRRSSEAKARLCAHKPFSRHIRESQIPCRWTTHGVLEISRFQSRAADAYICRLHKRQWLYDLTRESTQDSWHGCSQVAIGISPGPPLQISRHHQLSQTLACRRGSLLGARWICAWGCQLLTQLRLVVSISAEVALATWLPNT